MGQSRRDTLDDKCTTLRRKVRRFNTGSEPKFATSTRKGTGQSVVLRDMQLARTRLCVWSWQAGKVDCSHRTLVRSARFTVTKAKAMKTDVGGRQARVSRSHEWIHSRSSIRMGSEVSKCSKMRVLFDDQYLRDGESGHPIKRPTEILLSTR
jgi:hypothetical protein